MRALVYSWSQYDSSSLLAGGIAVVCRESIDFLLQRGAEVTFLYAGSDYSAWPRQPSVREVRNLADRRVRAFSLFDSPVFAPNFFVADQPRLSLEAPNVERAFAQFLKTHGPFDVIHFHSLEGISAGVLEVAKRSGARVIFTLHNYLPMCAQANLWRRDQRVCTDYHDGADCIDCLHQRGFARRALVTVKRWQALARALRLSRAHANDALGRVIDLYLFLARFGASGADRVIRLMFPAPRLSAPRRQSLAAEFKTRRETLIATLNRSVDYVICHSRHAEKTARGHGLRPELLAYLPHAYSVEQPPARRAPSRSNGKLKIVFLGRMLEEKGIYYLADELLALPPEIRQRIDLRLAGRLFPGGRIVRTVHALRAGLGTFQHIPGYRREALPGLLADRDLGIVPSLFPETLSLVTLELMHHGVPALISDRGALPELVPDAAFRFRPESVGDFRAKLLAIDADRQLLARFWNSTPRFPPAADYSAALESIYRGTYRPGTLSSTPIAAS